MPQDKADAKIINYDIDRKREPDILADYRQWMSMQEDRIGTHTDDCHMWPRHERCMIHRLAAELERLRQVLVPKNRLTERMYRRGKMAARRPRHARLPRRRVLGRSRRRGGRGSPADRVPMTVVA
jgi:hypothetical protein